MSEITEISLSHNGLVGLKNYRSFLSSMSISNYFHLDNPQKKLNLQDWVCRQCRTARTSSRPDRRLSMQDLKGLFFSQIFITFLTNRFSTVYIMTSNNPDYLLLRLRLLSTFMNTKIASRFYFLLILLKSFLSYTFSIIFQFRFVYALKRQKLINCFCF